MTQLSQLLVNSGIMPSLHSIFLWTMLLEDWKDNSLISEGYLALTSMVSMTLLRHFSLSTIFLKISMMIQQLLKDSMDTRTMTLVKQLEGQWRLTLMQAICIDKDCIDERHLSITVLYPKSLWLNNPKYHLFELVEPLALLPANFTWTLHQLESLVEFLSLQLLLSNLLLCRC